MPDCSNCLTNVIKFMMPPGGVVCKLCLKMTPEERAETHQMAVARNAVDSSLSLSPGSLPRYGLNVTYKSGRGASVASAAASVASSAVVSRSSPKRYLGLKKDTEKMPKEETLSEPPGGWKSWTAEHNLKWLDERVLEGTSFLLVGILSDIRGNFKEIPNRRHAVGMEILALISANYIIESGESNCVCVMVPPEHQTPINKNFLFDAQQFLTPGKPTTNHQAFWSEDLLAFYGGVLDYMESLQLRSLATQPQASASSSNVASSEAGIASSSPFTTNRPRLNTALSQSSPQPLEAFPSPSPTTPLASASSSSQQKSNAMPNSLRAQSSQDWRSRKQNT